MQKVVILMILSLGKWRNHPRRKYCG